MNLEQLTKHQIILLTLLVAFVTSIATGIVTVSLMGQSPPGVTKVVDQIVERTVQTVASPVAPQAAAVVTTQKTVVVKNDDLAAQSIAAVQKSIIRIVAKGDDKLIARGVIVGRTGAAFTDAGALANTNATEFEAILYSGERVPLTISKGQGTTSPLLSVTVAMGTSTLAGQADFAPATIGSSESLMLGQSIIRIGGVGADSVGEGVVATLPTKGSSDIETSVSSATPGSVILNLFGEVLGISTGESLKKGPGFYTSITTTTEASTTVASSTNATH